MAGRIAGITVEIGGDTTKLTNALKKVDQPLRKMKTALRDIDKLLKLNPGNVTLLEQKQKNLANAINKTKERLDQLKQVEESMRGQDLTEEQQRQYDALQREIIQTENDLKKLENQMREFGSVGAQQVAAVGKKMEQVGEKIKAAGQKISSAGQALLPVTAAITGVAAASYRAFQEVDAGGDTIARVTGATGDALAELQDIANTIATDIPTSFETAGSAVGEVSTRFDLQGDALAELSRKYVEFADVNRTDVTSSIDSTQKAMAAWNIESKDAGLYLDAITAAAQKTGIGVDTLAAQAATNAAALKEMDFSASDAVMFLGELEKNGVDASGAMAGLKKAYANALKDGTSLKDQLVELETGLRNEETRADAAAAAIELFGTRAGGALTEALASGRISFAELGTELQDFSGTVSSTFEATLDPIDSMKTAMNELKLVGADLVDSAEPLITDVIGKLTSGAQKLAKWFGSLTDAQKKTALKMAAVAAAAGPVLIVVGKIVTAVGSLVTGIGKGLQLAPKIVSAFKNVTTGAGSLVTKLLAVNPAVLAIVAGVTALTVAAIAAKKGIESWAEANYGLTQGQKDLIDQINASTEAYAAAESQRRETISGISEEYDYYQKLVEELQSITDADGRVLEGKEARAAFITGTLSDAFGIEIEMIDGVIQKNDELMSSIDAVIEKKRAEAILNADQGAYEDAIKGVGDAQQKYAEAVNNSTTAQERLNAAQERYDEAMAKYQAAPSPLTWLTEVVPAAAALDTAGIALGEMTNEAAKARETWTQMQATISNHEALAEAAISGEGLSEAMFNVANGFLTAETASADMLANQAAQFVTKYAEMQAAAQNGMTGITQTELDELRAGAQLAIEEANKAGADVGTALSTALSDKSSDVQAAAALVMDSSAPQTSTDALWMNEGSNIVEAFRGNLLNGVIPVQQAGEAVAQSGVTGAASKKVDMETTGGELGTANATGVSGTAAENEAAGVEIATAAESGAASVDLYPTGYNTGMNYGLGLVEGLNSQLGAVQAAAAALANAAAGASSGELQEQSPSKVAEKQGRFFGEGLVIGMDKMQRAVGRSAANLAGMAAGMTMSAPVSFSAPAAITNYPRQTAEAAARNITVTAQAAPSDGTVGRALNLILNRLNNLDVGIRNAGQVMDSVTSGVNRRLGRVAALEGSGVI